jgi:hypothetical protein
MDLMQVMRSGFHLGESSGGVCAGSHEQCALFDFSELTIGVAPGAVLRQKLLNQGSLQRTHWIFERRDVMKDHTCLRSFRVYNCKMDSNVGIAGSATP